MSSARSHQNTSTIFALVFIGRTCSFGRLLLIRATFFIFAAVAVLFHVTFPFVRYTRAVIATKLATRATRRFHIFASFLVRPISAIIVAIASKAYQYASIAWTTYATRRTFAFEFAFRAVGYWCFWKIDFFTP